MRLEKQHAEISTNIYFCTCYLFFDAKATPASEMEHSQQLSFMSLNLVMEIRFDM